MRIAIISDIHGNREALEAVLEKIDALDCDRIDCLGDIVGYGPDPGHCVDTVRERCERVVAGNHEHAVLGLIDTGYFNPHARKGTVWTRDHVDQGQKEYLASLALVEGDSGCTLVHGTLDSPDLFDYVQTSWDAQLTFQKMETPFCFIGHSHVPVAFLLEEAIRYSTDATIDVGESAQGIINVGSVGQPRDGNPESCFVIYDPDARRSERHRVPYDIAATQAKILEAGLPEFLAERLSVGR